MSGAPGYSQDNRALFLYAGPQIHFVLKGLGRPDMNSNALFAKTPPLKLFFIASIPGAVSMLASALYQTLDGVFVGQFLGATAFAALNLAMPFVIINFSLADLIGVGSSIPLSICPGR